MRYYYKQNDSENYLNLKEPLVDATNYTEITEEQFNAEQAIKVHVQTENDLAKMKEIVQCKAMLAKTDYIAIKHSEGWITDEDYAETKALRQSYRDRINELEQEVE